MLKKINKEEKRKELFNDHRIRAIELQCWEKRQDELKFQTPAEKTFRNYKSVFCWKYLLQYGFSVFFKTEDWKKEMPADTFKRFDKLIYERQPKMMKVFVKTLEKYFIDNPKEIWCSSEVMARFLPHGNIGSKNLILKKIK